MSGGAALWLRSHRPCSPPRDPKRPAHACWRLGEPSLHPLTGVGRPHAHAMPQSCTRASTHHQVERTHLHTTLHTAWLHTCTREQWQRPSSSSSNSSSDDGDDSDDNSSDGSNNNNTHCTFCTPPHAQHTAQHRHDCEHARVGTTAEEWQLGGGTDFVRKVGIFLSIILARFRTPPRKIWEKFLRGCVQQPQRAIAHHTVPCVTLEPLFTLYIL